MVLNKYITDLHYYNKHMCNHLIDLFKWYNINAMFISKCINQNIKLDINIKTIYFFISIIEILLKKKKNQEATLPHLKKLNRNQIILALKHISLFNSLIHTHVFQSIICTSACLTYEDKYCPRL